MPPVLLTAAAIALSTLASEDLATIGAGLLVREGHISFGLAVLACSTGIYAGDMAIVLGARLVGAGVLARLTRVHRTASAGEAVGRWTDAHLAGVVLASRCIPGTRVALCIAAGMWSTRRGAFAAWSLIAALLWTTVVVGVSAGVAAGLGAVVPQSGTLAMLIRAAGAVAAAAAGLLAARLVLRQRLPALREGLDGLVMGEKRM